MKKYYILFIVIVVATFSSACNSDNKKDSEMTDITSDSAVDSLDNHITGSLHIETDDIIIENDENQPDENIEENQTIDSSTAESTVGSDMAFESADKYSEKATGNSSEAVTNSVIIDSNNNSNALELEDEFGDEENVVSYTTTASIIDNIEYVESTRPDDNIKSWETDNELNGQSLTDTTTFPLNDTKTSTTAFEQVPESENSATIPNTPTTSIPSQTTSLTTTTTTSDYSNIISTNVGQVELPEDEF